MTAAKIDEHITRRYDIKRRLGEGAYGIVWKAIDKRNKEVVAVKKICDAFKSRTEAQRTFREIMLLQEFGSHPNIIKLHSIHRAVNNNDIYLVFEYMDTDLHNVIKRGTILKDVHKRFIMYQLLKATKYIHSGNVIHRDQKPSNILLNSDCICKIADFGLARSVGKTYNGSDEQMTNPALTDYVATRWYRAPEILIGSNWYTQGIDMWSIGCILAEMLLGRPIFQGTCTINQIELIMATIPAPTAEDLTHVSSSYGSSLLQKGPVVRQRSLKYILRNAPLDGIDLVSKLLVFNPHKRLTAAQALQHDYVRRFHCEASEPILGHTVVPPVRDDVQLSVDEYRSKLYELMATGTGAHTRPCKVNHEDRTQKFPEKGQNQQIYQPRTWAQVDHDSCSKKGRHLSAEVKTMPSIRSHHTIPMLINHSVPSQSDMKLCAHVAVPVTQCKRSSTLSHVLQHQPVQLMHTAAVVQQASDDTSNQQHIEHPKLRKRHWPSSVHSLENIDAVRVTLQRSPSKSTRKAPVQLGIYRQFVQ
ncbi:extracellular signal-regulated kinase 2 isoform X3 [Cryptotermes secundus]|uniref:extracellular signal-regulated kinase 2 isoform X3 n=1 Tax=Cryptotermes secundus TaxID=105785 RepID=UPI000CD7B352|nr:extracellular signal-regulated kinase 2 isoform X3 [Cryptotermes secundus]